MVTALKSGVRAITHDPFYTALNVIGLAVGFAAAILILLFARYEFSYDHFLPHYKRTYLITEHILLPGQTPIYTPAIQAGIAKLLRENFPQIGAITRLAADHVTLTRGTFESDEKLYWADPNVFGTLQLKAIEGDLQTALASPDSIVITKSVAGKYFGPGDPVGKTVLLNTKYPMKVTAVLADLPPNTHLDATVIASGQSAFSQLEALDANPNSAHISNLVYTYLQLPRGASVTALQRAFRPFLARQWPALHKHNIRVSLGLLRVDQIHLTPLTEESMRPTEPKAAIYGLLLVGVLIIAVASINFVNLLTARATRRAIEVAIRKTVGASRSQLAVQFMSETALQSVIALLIALAIVELALGPFNAVLGTQIHFAYWRDPGLAIGFSASAFLIGMLAGIYPALVLSAFAPSATLQGSPPALSSPMQLRQLLVSLQFAVLIALAVASLVIYRQIDYALHQPLNVDQGQVVSISTPCTGAFPDAVRALPGVRGAACAWSGSLNLGEEAHWLLQLPNGTNIQLDGDSVGYGFFQLYGLTPLAGRFFSRLHPADVAPSTFISFLQKGSEKPDSSATTLGRLVLNEAAVRLAGFRSPEDAIGKVLYVGGRPLQIIGVVRDFTFASVRNKIPPTFFILFRPSFDQISVKLTGRDLSKNTAAIASLWRDTGHLTPMKWVFMSEHMRAIYRDIVLRAQSLAVFCGITVLIACLGLFGLAAYAAEQRRMEIAVRKTFGARRYDIVTLSLWHFIKPIAWANIIAWPAAYIVMQYWLAGFAYHIQLGLLPFVYGSVLALVVAVATVSTHSFLMALQLPSAALRHE